MLLKLPELGILSTMSQQTITCTIINRSQATNRVLEAALRHAEVGVSLQYASSWRSFTDQLADAPALIFSPVDFVQDQEKRLLDALQRYSPDSLLVTVAKREWAPLKTRQLSIETCTISSGDPEYLQQQIDYLLNYASLKTAFRHSKHLLSIAELRCQWLVDYSREPVAYVGKGRHLHANNAYLSLFGFHSEVEVVATPVLSLVKEDEHSVFIPLSGDAELSSRPSNWLLMTFLRRDKSPFRAEVRFIPSVFRGQRCVQLHIHALQAVEDAPKQKAVKQKSPWDQLSPTPSPTSTPEPVVQKPAVAVPAVRMRAHFLEALNLRASGHPSLLLSEPYLQYVSGKCTPYRRLVRDADQGSLRLRLDHWNLRSALLHPLLQRKDSTDCLMFVQLGSWLFQQHEPVRELIRLLQGVPMVAHRLVLAIPQEHHVRFTAVAGKVLPALRATGVRLALDNVQGLGSQALTVARAMGAELVRLHPDHVRNIVRLGTVPAALSELIQVFDDAGIIVIVDGVQEITSLNLLCETAATYLQGDILNKVTV